MYYKHDLDITTPTIPNPFGINCAAWGIFFSYSKTTF